MDHTIGAVDRALQLLEIVAEHPDVGLSELARPSGASKTLAFRMASTLDARGYLSKDPVHRIHVPGYEPLYLAERMQRASALARTADPVLDDLAARTRENVLLLVREDLHTVCVTGDLEGLHLRMLVEAAAEVSARLGFTAEPVPGG